MALIDLPNTLGAAFWEKQKAALAKVPKAPSTKLGDELKLLTRLHLGLDWDAFGSDKLDRVEQAEARLGEFEAAVRGKIKALLEQVGTVEASATKFEADAKKDKQFPKEPLVAVATVVKAAKAYRTDVDAAVLQLRKSLGLRVTALTAAAKAEDKAGAKGDAGKSAGDAKAIAMVRSRGLDAIKKIMKPTPGAKTPRFLVVQGRSMVATFMGASVGKAQEDLLKGLLPNDAPYKVFKDPAGQLVWEKKAITFVSDVLPSGIAKKMQLWLKPILKINPKIRLRRTNGEAEETDGEDIPEDQLIVDEADLGDEFDDEPEETEEGEASTSPEQTAYAQRAAALELRVRQAIVDKHPEVTKLRGLLGFASEKADGKGDGQGDYPAAMKALDMLEKLLGVPLPGSASPAPATPGTGAPPKLATTVVYNQSRLVWTATRGGIQSELKKLEQEILDSYRGQPIEGEVRQAVRKLDRVLDLFDESLIANLDKVAESTDVAAKERWHGEARSTIARYQKFLATDPLVKELDGNPFVPLTVQAKLTSTLATLAAKIA